MLHVGNTWNKTATINSSPILGLSNSKDILKVVSPANLLAPATDHSTKQHRFCMRCKQLPLSRRPQRTTNCGDGTGCHTPSQTLVLRKQQQQAFLLSAFNHIITGITEQVRHAGHVPLPKRCWYWFRMLVFGQQNHHALCSTYDWQTVGKISAMGQPLGQLSLPSLQVSE